MAAYIKSKRGQLPKREQGNILVMFTIGLFALIAMAALALDGGHLLLNKSRLQNIADAAALHAAKTLDEGGTHQEARAAVIEIIGLNLGSISDHAWNSAHPRRDNFEINDALDLSVIDTSAIQVTGAINVDFAMQPDPPSGLFESSTSEDARYVKVEIRNLNLNNFLADIMNFTKRVSATAMAGPSTAIPECPVDLVPILVCARELDPPYFGLVPNGTDSSGLYVMKSGSASASDPAIGPGNFQLLRLDGSTGANDLKYALAGAGFTDAEACESTVSLGKYVATEPGNTVGPSLKGINTRLGVHENTMKGTEGDYPRDVNTCQGKTRVKVYTNQDVTKKNDIDTTAPEDVITEDMIGEINIDTIDNAYEYSDYKSGEACPNAPTGNIDTSTGVAGRRILKLVIGDCNEDPDDEYYLNGATNVKVLGTACFFLTQEMGGGNDDFIIGEFLGECNSVGPLSEDAADNPGPHTIVLYHVPSSKDS